MSREKRATAVSHPIHMQAQSHRIHARRACKPSPHSGFTLIELVVVLTLIAILSAAIIPEMRGSMEETLLRATARDVVAACQSANTEAVASGQPQRLVLDTRSHRFRIQSAPRPGSPDARRAPVDEAPRGESGRLDPRITLEVRRTDPAPSDAPDALEFQPDGTATAADILLRDRSGFTLAIHLNPITARASVREVNRQTR